MANGVEEFNPQTNWNRFTAGFKGGESQTYNKPPELRFIDGISAASKQVDPTVKPTGQVLDSWVTRYPNGKVK